MGLWGGRFQGRSDRDAWLLNASIGVDQRLAKQDIKGSIAWAEQLSQHGILSPAEHEQIQNGLNQILDEFNAHQFEFQAGDEDIHTAVERRLYEIIGATAGKLHTGRSRNDQVATDFRLWMLDNLPDLVSAIRDLQTRLVERAEGDLGVVMPSYTHLQRAQPVLTSHWWLSFFWPLERDILRLKQTMDLCGVLPLGSGAVAGTSMTVDREAMAQALGFDSISQNSMDAVSDRDFVAQFLFNASLCAVHLSKFAEQIILFSSSEFGFITLDDAFATGSSLMPQKKNPDVFELTRGKTGSLLGLLTGFMATLKGLPSTYDKDLQEDKQAVFQAFDTLMAIIPVFSGAIVTLRINADKMAAAIDPSMFATDVADVLVRAGIPFREAHGMVGEAVKLADETGRGIHQLSTKEWDAIIPTLNLDLSNVFSPQESIKLHSMVGGTAPQAVSVQINTARRCLNAK